MYSKYLDHRYLYCISLLALFFKLMNTLQSCKLKHNHLAETILWYWKNKMELSKKFSMFTLWWFACEGRSSSFLVKMTYFNPQEMSSPLQKLILSGKAFWQKRFGLYGLASSNLMKTLLKLYDNFLFPRRIFEYFSNKLIKVSAAGIK